MIRVSTSYALVDNLHLTTLLALDEHTFEVFASLHAENGGRFLRWPLEAKASH